MERKPIRAFYCCYLLRSKQKDASSEKLTSSYYIGSTPDPVRRLAQHNKHIKGGAVRTSRGEPGRWRMAAIVTGFPTSIAALQFEWAWQNPHVTKRVADEQRVIKPEKEKPKQNKSPPPKIKRRPRKPIIPLSKMLSNLHLLLNAPSFARWPLQLHFFCDDTYQKWQRHTSTMNGSASGNSLQIFVETQNLSETIGKANASGPEASRGGGKEATGNGMLESIDISYGTLKPHLVKSLSLLPDSGYVECSVCSKSIGTERKLALTCPREGCMATSHMTCLGNRFLDENGRDASIMPVSGKCPVCGFQQKWIDLVKEMSLRVYGGKQVIQLAKERKHKLAKETKADDDLLPQQEKHDSGVENNVKGHDDPVEDFHAADTADDALPDDWYYQEGCDDIHDDMISVSNVSSGFSSIVRTGSPSKASQLTSRTGIVIEDSEGDDAEVLD